MHNFYRTLEDLLSL